MLHSLKTRLKPNATLALYSNQDEYSEMVEKIEKWLSNATMFDQLTIHQVHCLSTFTSTSITQVNQIDLMYGDHWFYTNEEYNAIINK